MSKFNITNIENSFSLLQNSALNIMPSQWHSHESTLLHFHCAQPSPRGLFSILPWSGCLWRLYFLLGPVSLFFVCLLLCSSTSVLWLLIFAHASLHTHSAIVLTFGPLWINNGADPVRGRNENLGSRFEKAWNYLMKIWHYITQFLLSPQVVIDLGQI